MRLHHAISIVALALGSGIGAVFWMGAPGRPDGTSCQAVLEAQEARLERIERSLDALASSAASAPGGASAAATPPTISGADLADLRTELARELRVSIDRSLSAPRSEEELRIAVLRDSAENERAHAAATRLVADALAQGRWTTDHGTQLVGLSHSLTPDQYDELQSALVQAENEGGLEREALF